MKVDATSPTPKSAEHVRLAGCSYDRTGLETAWLLLAEHDGDRMPARQALLAAGYSIAETAGLITAADVWTGNVVSSIKTT